ncbi:MAG: hypothetical protein JWM57_1122 [Phycisphaerales bacterium]|nr:hypothetical protein [Phycisphaerales bacterium]
MQQPQQAAQSAHEQTPWQQGLSQHVALQQMGVGQAAMAAAAGAAAWETSEAQNNTPVVARTDIILDIGNLWFGPAGKPGVGQMDQSINQSKTHTAHV